MNRRTEINLTCVVLMLVVAVLGCSRLIGLGMEEDSSGPPVPQAYLGKWAGADGSTVTFRNDKTGDYESGGKTGRGVKVEVDEAAREIRFTFRGTGVKKYKIDVPPRGNKMKLDGMDYVRTGGGGNRTAAETAQVPPEGELRELVFETLSDFGRAVQEGDFAEFYETISEEWKSQATAEEFNRSFATSIRNNLNFVPRSESAIDFEQADIKDEAYMTVTVKYTTTGNKTPRIGLIYHRENGEWKVFGLQQNPK